MSTPTASDTSADAERLERNATICARRFGRPVRQDPVLEPGEYAHEREPARAWYCQWRDTVGRTRWFVVPGYDRRPWDARALRRRLCECGYDVGLFAEGGPQFTRPLSGRVVCVVRSGGEVVARGEGTGEYAVEEATAAAAHALVTAPAERTAPLPGGRQAV